MKKAGKIALLVLLALVVVVAAYVIYVLTAYHRLGDGLLAAEFNAKPEELTEVAVDTPYTAMSYNIGFGAYESDYSFFMDGGTESWAWSEDRLTENLMEIGQLLQTADKDFYFLQEVDRDSTRSYHVDQVSLLNGYLGGRSTIWAQNYDSPFLFYPFTQPHGASVSGITTASRYLIHDGRRVELPIEESLMKLVDLDRCYSSCRVDVAGGGELVLYNLHLSAYTSDGTIAEEQLKLLLADMQKEYEAGNWCVAGGDFNKDLLGNSEEVFGLDAGEYTWAQPIPESMFTGLNLRLVPPLEETTPVPSCRNADAPYHKDQYVVTVDGFLVSDNVTVQQATVVDTGFAYSDHNPVQMTFLLKR
ncbi:MAG: endonuclease/exonuclease/phosphatase family protein [Ruminococcaceae bacterium]|nr:endonuclease/exonuclease/phosphatase family protein [Oscillospiraceae bacterium]